MCNAFNTAKKTDQIRLDIREATELIRRTDHAPVVLPSGKIVSMRWGFQRKGLGVVNNTRSDNLESQMWREAIARRRCIIPVSSYFEWTGPKGNKQTHLFRSPRNDWLWMAGIWEDSADFGRCFSMLTTEANSLVATIHHRMPAILTKPEQKEYLLCGLEKFAPTPDLLIIERSSNPLLKHPPSHIQEELF